MLPIHKDVTSHLHHQQAAPPPSLSFWALPHVPAHMPAPPPPLSPPRPTSHPHARHPAAAPPSPPRPNSHPPARRPAAAPAWPAGGAACSCPLQRDPSGLAARRGARCHTGPAGRAARPPPRAQRGQSGRVALFAAEAGLALHTQPRVGGVPGRCGEGLVAAVVHKQVSTTTSPRRHGRRRMHLAAPHAGAGAYMQVHDADTSACNGCHVVGWLDRLDERVSRGSAHVTV